MHRPRETRDALQGETRCGREICRVRKLGSLGVVVQSAGTELRTRPAVLAHISDSASSRAIVIADRLSRGGRGAREEDEGEGGERGEAAIGGAPRYEGACTHECTYGCAQRCSDGPCSDGRGDQSGTHPCDASVADDGHRRRRGQLVFYTGTGTGNEGSAASRPRGAHALVIAAYSAPHGNPQPNPGAPSVPPMKFVYDHI